MKKWLALVLTIVLTVVGTLGIVLYDYNVFYSPDGSNGSVYSSEYKQYLIGKVEKSMINEDLSIQTENKIDLNMKFNGEYYSLEPIFKKDVELDGKRIFTLAIYKNVITYAPNADTNEYRYRYEIFAYNVDYEALRNMFLKEPVPEDKTLITKADYPQLAINFYPNDEYNDEESLYYSATSVINLITLNNGDEIYRNQFTSSPAFTLCDYGSNPSKKDEDKIFTVGYIDFRSYDNQSENMDLFSGDTYVKVDAICKTSEVTYILSESLLEEKVEGFEVRGDINVENYEKGYNTSSNVSEVLNNVDIKGVLKYNGWLFTRYVWWQMLIAIALLFVVFGGFFFALSLDSETKGKQKKNNKKVNANTKKAKK